MSALVGLWSHALAAVLYGGLALSAYRFARRDKRSIALVGALSLSGAWSLSQALASSTFLPDVAEAGRNLAFLIFMYTAVGRGAQQRSLHIVYGAVAATIALQIIVSLLLPVTMAEGGVSALAATQETIGMTIAAGGLILVHNLYAQTARNSRWGIRLPAIALAAMWGFDLHLYTIARLTGESVADLFALRGIIAVMLVPLFAVGMRRNQGWQIQLSRSATFRFLSLIALATYFLLMVSTSRAIEPIGHEWTQVAQLVFVLIALLAGLAAMPSSRARAWLHVMVAKHLFEHRYDYREDWLRFSRTIGSSGEDGLTLEERVVKALAELAGSQGGVLLSREDASQFTCAGSWNWAHGDMPEIHCEGPFTSILLRRAFIIDFGAMRHGAINAGGERVSIPNGLLFGGASWAAIPLIHGERLLGFVLLDAPPVRRPLDWEDFDLFRAAGTQAASYLAEARGQEALGEARRFDEFNRRFAFIIHDVKNLVSQLSLVARNAERHADNPEFRADMIATLQSSVNKMNDLLARISRDNGGETRALAPLPVISILSSVANLKRSAHRIEVTGEASVYVLADWSRLEQAIGHLVQNGIEASPPDIPVRLSFARDEGGVVISVEDQGIGMSKAFQAASLFRPFLSTKEGGFGIGAFEARSLVASMGGRLSVESSEGKGTRFTIWLKEAQAPTFELQAAQA